MTGTRRQTLPADTLLFQTGVDFRKSTVGQIYLVSGRSQQTDAIVILGVAKTEMPEMVFASVSAQGQEC